MLQARCWMFDAGYWILDTRYRLPAIGLWSLVAEIVNLKLDLLTHEVSLFSRFYHYNFDLIFSMGFFPIHNLAVPLISLPQRGLLSMINFRWSYPLSMHASARETT